MTHEDIARVIAGMLKKHIADECVAPDTSCKDCVLHNIVRGCGTIGDKHTNGSIESLTQLLYIGMQKGLLEESPDDK